MSGFSEWLSASWNKYFVSYEGIASLLVVLIISLKLFINRKVTSLHLKRTVVSIPSEITFLVMGFLLSKVIATPATTNFKGNFALVVLSCILIVIQYALERHLDDKLSGKLPCKIVFCIVVMYILSLVLYYVVVFGGANNA